MSAEADPESSDGLRRRLAEATSAAQNAYRDTTRLIRLLMVIGRPTTPDRLIREALATLSDVFSADVVCIAHPVGDCLFVSSACGLPSGAAGFQDGWPHGEAAMEAIETGHSVARDSSHSSIDLPAELAELGIKSRAWVPLTTGAENRGLMILCRSSGETFSEPDIGMLDAVAYRLCLSIEAAQRLAARERLTLLSHRLARHLDTNTLLVEVAELLRGLTEADSTAVVAIDGDKPVLYGAMISARPIADWPDRAEGMAGWAVAATGTPFVRDDVSLDPQAGFVWPTGSRSFLSVPAMREGRVVALLNSGRVGLAPFDRDTVEVAGVFANQVAVAMANASLHRALAASEARLRLIADSTAGLVAVVDRAGAIRYASPSFCKVLSTNSYDLVNRNAADLCHSDDRERFLEAIRAPEQEPTVQYRLRNQHGGWISVESRLSSGTSPSDEVVLTTHLVEPPA
jgi:PAS domain S-box-containing protein